MAIVPERIKALRERRGMTQDGLAESLGMNRANVSNYERGIVTNIPADVLQKMADIFNTSTDYLLGRTDNPAAILPEEDSGERLRRLVRELSTGPWGKRHFSAGTRSLIESESKELQSAYDIDFDIAPDDILQVCKETQDPDFIDDMIKMLETVLLKDRISEQRATTLSVKEERDLATDLERLVSDLETNEALAFNGEEFDLDEESRELLRMSLEQSMRLAKQMAKQKFNPNKNKK